MTKLHLKDQFVKSAPTYISFGQAREIIADIYGISAEGIPPEFFDVLNVVANGAKKYELNGWLKPDGQKASFKEMHESLFRHIGASATGVRDDLESGLDHLLHVACRALMLYTLLERGIRSNEVKYPKE